jgi:hypothetical protein
MTANESDNNFSLLKHVPAILRARGYRLYTKDGRRLVDLWLNGGAAVLGHTPANMLRDLKNVSSRGLFSPLPHFTEGRFLKALSRLFPGCFFRLYAAPSHRLINFKLWRPFNDLEEEAPIFVPVLPGVQSWRIQDGVVLPLGLFVVGSRDEKLLETLPVSDVLPPVLLAAATRGIHDILAALTRAKDVLTIKSLKVLEKSRWKRRGIYLSLKEEPKGDEWTLLFKKFLEAGFLLPPSPLFPVILPGELSAGEEAKLAGVLGF